MVKTESLKDRAMRSKSRIDWPAMVFLAEAEREWFEDVTVITLKAHYQNKAYEMAWDQIDAIEGLDERAKGLMNSGKIKVQEFIKIDENSNVEICIDRDEITDEVVEEALDLLAEANITPNAMILFGEIKTFPFNEMEAVFNKYS